MAGMDWRRTRKYWATEEKYEPGKVLDNGRMVASRPRDELEARARREERRKAKGARYQLTPYDRERMGIRQTKPLEPNPPDIALEVLSDLSKPPWE
jgi:hypothetical protein